VRAGRVTTRVMGWTNAVGTRSAVSWRGRRPPAQELANPFRTEVRQVILVVEDDPQVGDWSRSYWQRTARLPGRRRRCLCFSTGEGDSAADDSCRSHDQRMNGAVLCRELKGRRKRVRSRSSFSRAIVTCREAAVRADDYLMKPFEFPDLIRLVEAYARAES